MAVAHVPVSAYGDVLAGVAALFAGWSNWQNHRLQRGAEVARVQLDGWQLLLSEARTDIAECRTERERLKVELSSVRTLVIALRKVHEGEFPTLPDIEAAMRGLHDPGE